MTQKNRITYRFDRNGQTVNGDEHSFDNEQEAPEQKTNNPSNPTESSNQPAKINVIPLYPSTNQYATSELSPWNSPFQEDIVALEQLIRNADDKAAPTTQKQNKMSQNLAQPVKLNTHSQEELPPKEKLKIVPPKRTAQDYEEKDNYSADTESHFPSEDDQSAAGSYEEELLYEEPRRSKPQYSRVKRSGGTPSWFNVFLSVTAALATGALFGYLLLSLFTGASIWPGGSGEKPASLPVTGNIVPGSGNEGTKAGTGKATGEAGTEVAQPPAAKPEQNVATISLKGLEQTYYMLQFGVFSNTEGRDAAVAQLAQKGLAGASLTSATDYRVYAGLAGDRTKAKTLRALLPDLELYIKEITIATPAKFPFKGEQATAQAFFDQTASLVQMLDELTLAQLEQPSLSALSEAATASWKAEYQKWTENAAAMRIGIVDAVGKTYLEKINQSVNAAAQSMTEYNKKPSQAHLWSAQLGVMGAILTQKEWFETNSAL